MQVKLFVLRHFKSNGPNLHTDIANIQTHKVIEIYLLKLDNFAVAHVLCDAMYFIVNNTKWGFYVFPGFIIEVGKYRYHWNLKIHLELHKKCVFLAALEVMKYRD